MSETTGPAARRALPPRDDEPASTGARRFATSPLDDDLDDDEVPGPPPRRSLPPVDEPAVPQPVDVARPGTGTPSRRLALVAGGLAAVAVITVGALWASQGGWSGTPAPTPTPTLDRAQLLAEPADLAGLREGTTWAVAETLEQIKADSPQPRCVASVADTEPKAGRSWLRTFTASGGDAAAALHQLDHYADAEAATTAFTARVKQLGSCARSTALLTATRDITGVADQAIAATFVLQNAEPEYHTVLVARAGADVNIVDLTAAKQALSIDAAAKGLSALGTRQCGLTSATCPTSPAVVERTPPVTDPAGWLAGVDIPRLTPGAGTWRGTDVTPLKLTGAACEAVDLNNVAGTSSKQRTYLVHDDPRANGIGVDEAIYTFASQPEAAAFYNQVVPNVDGCASRTATATVQRTGETGRQDAPGVSWSITQKMAGDQTATFRVATVTSGARVLYVFANPTATVNFTDADWQAIVMRATERLGQLT